MYRELLKEIELYGEERSKLSIEERRTMREHFRNKKKDLKEDEGEGEKVWI